MKNSIIISVIIMLLHLFPSCSNEAEHTPAADIYIAVSLSTGQATRAGAELTYDLYMFSSPGSGTPYSLAATISPVVNGSQIPMQVSELQNNTYRFLFVAQPAQTPQFSVVKGSASEVPDAGTLWSEIGILRTAELTLDNYYGITDMSGAEIISSAEIHGDLSRIAGRMVFDCFRTEGSVDAPIAVDTDIADSVFDRIYSIEMKYTGFTDKLVFDDDLKLVADVQSPNTVEQSIAFELTDDFRIADPQDDALFIPDYDGIGGRGRILGPVVFPADKSVKIEMTFHYFDTTPVCGNKPDSVHAHEDVCFVQKELVLNMPKEGMDGMSVLSNTYTVNKAGILANRVIDVPKKAGMSIVFDWNASVPYPIP